MKRFLLWGERLFLFLFILFIPTQLGKHFWPEWSYVWGIRVDYFSPVLYFLDLLWVSWFGFYVWSGKKIETKITFKFFIFLMFVAVNILIAKNQMVAVYKWFRLGQLVLTWVVFRKDRKRVEEFLTKAIPWWVILESLLGLGQVLIGSSVNGWAYFLGERRFAYTTLGVAQISVLGQGLVRAYGTFSHPNSLAGFLLVSLIIWFGKKKEINRTFWWAITWMAVVGIVVSGSRLVWILTMLVIMAVTYLQSRDKKKVVGVGITLIGIFVLLVAVVSVNYRSSDFLGGWDKEGLSKRISLNMSAMRMVRINPLFGVGLGNFIVRLPEMQKSESYFWLQPVHNIGLLVLSEIGFFGLIWVFLFLSGLNRGRVALTQKMIWVAILVTGMFDHYWLTLPQNSWFLVVVMAIL
ncbi:MAG: O-antigen ligase family protein [Candidatus Shapirobacteria bacterium]